MESTQLSASSSLGTFPGRRDVPTGPSDRWSGGRIFLVEDCPPLAAGLRMTLSAVGWHVETATSRMLTDTVDRARAFDPHCVLLDLDLGAGVGSGIGLIGPLASTGADVVGLTAERRRTNLARCLEAGAAGFVSKDATVEELDATLGHLVSGRTIIGRTIRAALLAELRAEREREGRVRATFEALTPREALVLAALSDGLSAEEIAREHVVALATVRSQIRSVLQKLGVRSQLAAVASASAHRPLLPERGSSGRDRRRGWSDDRRSAPGGPIPSIA